MSEQPEKVLHCEECRLPFRNQDRLTDHIDLSHRKACMGCSKTFRYQSTLDQHLETAHDTDPKAHYWKTLSQATAYYCNADSIEKVNQSDQEQISKVTTTFSLFPELPIELHLKIWTRALRVPVLYILISNVNVLVWIALT